MFPKVFCPAPKTPTGDHIFFLTCPFVLFGSEISNTRNSTRAFSIAASRLAYAPISMYLFYADLLYMRQLPFYRKPLLPKVHHSDILKAPSRQAFAHLEDSH